MVLLTGSILTTVNTELAIKLHSFSAYSLLLVRRVALSLLIHISFSEQKDYAIAKMSCKSLMDLVIQIVSSINTVSGIYSFKDKV